MSKRIMEPGSMLNPVPVVMVSCGDIDGEKNIITVAWTGTVNSDPPMVYISVRRERFSYRLIREAGEFVINLVTDDIAFAADWCGVRSGKDYDKFREQQLTPQRCSRVKCPAIKESPVSIECRVREVIELGSHDMFLAEIVAVDVDDSLFDSEDRIRLDRAGLIAFSHGEYFSLHRSPVGKFGYSVMKPKTRKRKAAKRRRGAGVRTKKQSR